MARILFVTGSAGGVGFGDLQHWVALRKSNWWFRQCSQRIADEGCNDVSAE